MAVLAVHACRAGPIRDVGVASGSLAADAAVLLLQLAALLVERLGEIASSTFGAEQQRRLLEQSLEVRDEKYFLTTDAVQSLCLPSFIQTLPHDAAAPPSQITLSLFVDACAHVSAAAASDLWRLRMAAPSLQPLWAHIVRTPSLAADALATCTAALNRISATEAGDVPWPQAALLLPLALLAPPATLRAMLQAAATNPGLHPALLFLLMRTFPTLLGLQSPDGGSEFESLLYAIFARPPPSLVGNAQHLAAFARFVVALYHAAPASLGLEYASLLRGVLTPSLHVATASRDLVLATALALLCADPAATPVLAAKAAADAALHFTWSAEESAAQWTAAQRSLLRSVTWGVVRTLEGRPAHEAWSLPPAAVSVGIRTAVRATALHLPLLAAAGALPSDVRAIGDDRRLLELLAEVAQVDPASATAVQSAAAEDVERRSGSLAFLADVWRRLRGPIAAGPASAAGLRRLAEALSQIISSAAPGADAARALFAIIPPLLIRAGLPTSSPLPRPLSLAITFDRICAYAARDYANLRAHLKTLAAFAPLAAASGLDLASALLLFESVGRLAATAEALAPQTAPLFAPVLEALVRALGDAVPRRPAGGAGGGSPQWSYALAWLRRWCVAVTGGDGRSARIGLMREMRAAVEKTLATLQEFEAQR